MNDECNKQNDEHMQLSYLGCDFGASEVKTLNDYRNLMDKRFPDLQQYPSNGRGRGECKDKSLQTLTTNSSSIYSEEQVVLIQASKHQLSC